MRQLKEKHNCVFSSSGRHQILWGKFSFSCSLFEWRKFLLLVVLCAIIALVVYARESGEKLLLRCRCNCIDGRSVAYTQVKSPYVCLCAWTKLAVERAKEWTIPPHHALDKRHTCRTIFKCSVRRTHTWAYQMSVCLHICGGGRKFSQQSSP